MSILKDKMRPLFQEAIVTKLAVTQSTTRSKMKAADIIFPIIPHDSWAMSLCGSSGSETTGLQSWAYVQNQLKR